MSAPDPDDRIGLWFSTLSGWNVCAPDDPHATVTYAREGRPAALRMGWRCVWMHPTVDEENAGSWWEDRETAEQTAEALRRGGARNVRVKASREHLEEVARNV